MDDRITIVTAFFPLGRENWNGFRRDDEKYLRYFEFWARIRNDLVVYTSPSCSDAIRKIREGFGRSNTRIVEIDDFRTIDPELLGALEKAAGNRYARAFHRLGRNPESWNAGYDYMMALKVWCVADAVNNGYAGDTAVWLDFGYNHGGTYYKEAGEFDFEWKHAFDRDRMTVFALRDIDDGIPVFEIVRNMNSYITGGLIAGPTRLWPEFAALVREKMMALTSVGLVDDDQTALLMACRSNPEMFNIIRSDWFTPLQLCSDHNFTVDSSTLRKEPGTARRIKLWLRNRRRTIAHLARIRHILKDIKYD